MTAKRAAGYSGVALLLLAWLSSAGGIATPAPDVQESAKPVETAGTASLASEVQAQTERLKTRLAAAPAPQQPFRNPFSFATREPAARRGRRPVQETLLPVTPATPPEPAIELIGVAETTTATGPARTAIISALSGELFLVKEGDLVASRYRVKAIGDGAVELSDLAQGTVRRLALRE